MGGGLWALVAQNALNILIACIVMRVTVKLKLRFVCNFNRVKALFSYGWKLLVSSLLETLYQDIRSLVIGKKYDSGTLGYYNRGKQFPQFIINSVNGAVQSVMLPAMSAHQDDKVRVKNMMRNSIIVSAYIIFPRIAGLAAVAEPLVSILLTDKWLPCVPYIQIYCVSFAFHPVHSCNLQAINAMGRSDIFLKLEIIKKIIGVASIAIAVTFFDSPIAIAMTGVFTAGISGFINAYPNKKLINYSYFEQTKDLIPSMLLSGCMFVIIFLIGRLQTNVFLGLFSQVILGIIVYLFLSKIFNIKALNSILFTIKNLKDNK